MRHKRIAFVFAHGSGWRWESADAPEVGGFGSSQIGAIRQAEEHSYEVETEETVAKALASTRQRP